MANYKLSVVSAADFLKVAGGDRPTYIRFAGLVYPIKEGASYTEVDRHPSFTPPSVEMDVPMSPLENMVCDYFSKDPIEGGRWYPEIAGYRCQLLKLPLRFTLEGADLERTTIPSLYRGEALQIALYLGGAIVRRIPLLDVQYVQEDVKLYQGVWYRRALLKDGKHVDILA